jgi:hypothetical protein
LCRFKGANTIRAMYVVDRLTRIGDRVLARTLLTSCVLASDFFSSREAYDLRRQ